MTSHVLHGFVCFHREIDKIAEDSISEETSSILANSSRNDCFCVIYSFEVANLNSKMILSKVSL